MYLSDLYPNYDIENQDFECKLKLNNNSTQGEMITWTKCVGGMANNNGGKLFVGVKDDDMTLVGFDKKEADEQRLIFINGIDQHFTPSIICAINFIKYTIRQKERFILEITIYESKLKPVVVKYKGIPGIYMHKNGVVSAATYEEIREMALKTNDVDYDTLTSNIKYKKENFTKLQNFYNLHTNNKELSDKALQSMSFFDSSLYLKNGAVLFLDDYKGDKTLVSCTLFSGTTRGDQIIPTINEFRGNIIDSIDYMMQFITMRMNRKIIKLSDGRKEINSYPQRALFEGIINAIAHRDYLLNGTQIQIDMFQDRLEISSPGSFYNQKELAKTYDLENIISARRNTLICNILVACKVMEAKGTGFEKIIDDYKNEDINHQPYVISTRNKFTLVLPDLTYENGLINSDEPELIYVQLVNGSRYDKQILSYCYRTKRSVKEIVSHINVSDSSYFRKQILDNLVNNNYLIKTKEGNATYYLTNKKYVSIS